MLPGPGCEYAAVERVNKDHVAPVLHELVQQPFFRYFKVGARCWHLLRQAAVICMQVHLWMVTIEWSSRWCMQVNLWCECPFWPDDGMCMLRDCSVCECEDEEVPAPWKRQEAGGDAPCDGALVGMRRVLAWGTGHGLPSLPPRNREGGLWCPRSSLQPGRQAQARG